jgi:hypothetical protein
VPSHSRSGSTELRVTAQVPDLGAYAGLAFAYHEVVTQGTELERMTDMEWVQVSRDAPDVPWTESVLR